jgi:hypothetical protein
MILPYMPTSLVRYLPTLFNIYARLLFWDRERSGSIEFIGDDLSPKNPNPSTSGWDACLYAPESDELTIPHLLSYFTILYGLYPINFMDYIRKPQRYLRHAQASNPEEIKVQPTEIRHKSEAFRQCHLLHPNFYTLTIDSEKTDFNRWHRSEPAELVAECMALCISPESSICMPNGTNAIPSGPIRFVSEEFDRDGVDAALLSGSSVLEPPIESWRLAQSPTADSASGSRINVSTLRQSSQSSHLSNRDSMENRTTYQDPGGDSPTLPPHLVMSSSHTQLQDMIYSNKVIKSGLNQSLANDSVPSLSLSHQESIPEKPVSQPQLAQPNLNSPLVATDVNAHIAQLQKYILLLQNDLSFERYLKQQHVAHIGGLRQRLVKEAAGEAETQNLIINNRNLKSRLEDAKKAEMQVRKESEKSRTLAKKWESDLSIKLKNLREETKRLKSEEDGLRRELQSSNIECQKLRKLLCDAEVTQLNSTQGLQSVELSNAEIDRLKSEVDRLVLSERDFQAREKEREAAITAAAGAENRAEILSMKLISRETELLHTRQLYETQILNLRSKLLETQENSRGPEKARDTSAILESALAASKAKQAELQKQYSLLMRKYTVLQSSLLDMNSSPSSAPPRSEIPFHMDADFESSPRSASPANVRVRPHRVFSDPEMFEATSYNVTSPLGSKPATPTVGGPSHRPSTPPGGEMSGSGTLNLSPDQRYYGRGKLKAGIYGSRSKN